MAVRPVALSLLPYMRRAWWRKLEQQGVWHGANTTMVLGMAVVGLIAVMVGSIVAFKSLRSDATTQGMMILAQCLNAALMGWLIVPIMVGSTTAEGRGLQPVRMGQFPLGIGDLLAIGLLGRLVQPVYWILIGTSLCVMLPLTATPQPATGLAAGALFIIFAALLAWSVELFGSALFSSRHGREMMMLGVLILTMPMLVLIIGDFALDDGGITFTFFGHTWLLIGAEGLLTKVRVVSPSLWVTGAADGSGVLRGFLFLGIAVVLSAWLAQASLRRVMLHPPASLRGRRGAGQAIGWLRGLPMEMGPLVIKEIRYLIRTLDHLMGVGMGLAALVWILIRPEHMIFVLPLAAMNIVMNEAAIPLNIFGLDRSGADRYRLLPLSGRQVLLTKNLAYFALVGIHMIPLVVAGLLKGGGLLALCTLLATAAVCLVTAVGGNAASINSPAPRAFFNFDSKEQAGGGLSLFLAALVWAAPTVVFFALYWVGLWAVAFGMSCLLVVAWFIYRWRLPGAGRSFEESAETMRARLGGE